LETSGNRDSGAYHKQTILNLYSSGIPLEIISLQLDLPQSEVEKVIEEEAIADKMKVHAIKKISETPSLGSFYLDAVFDLDTAIELAQSRTWKALNATPEFNISFKKTYDVLEQFVGSKVTLVILHIDIVGSTKLSMGLPADKLAVIIQTFTHEMSVIIDTYGGYLLKYVGDAILAFFLVRDKNDFNIPGINAISCAQSMIQVIKNGINPILNQYGYPEINCRIGIDFGENVVVQFGYDTYSHKGHSSSNINDHIVRIPHLDILGYTISIASKMTSFAHPDQIIIGELVYNALDDRQKEHFKEIHINPEIWSYVSDNTGGIYRLYGS
jgi:class 3 adenylate cyclase